MTAITPQAVEAAEKLIEAAELGRQLIAALDAATPANAPVPWTSDVNQVRTGVQQLCGGGRWQPHSTVEAMAHNLLQEAQRTPEDT